MNEKKDLEYYMSLQYNAVLKQIDDSYFFIIPELQIFSKGKTVNEAFETLEGDKEKYFKNIIELEEHDIVNVPKSVVPKRKELFGDILPFIVKTLSVAVILIIMSIIALPFTVKKATRIISGNLPALISKSVSSGANQGLHQLESRIERHVQKYKNLSDENKEITRKNIRNYIQQIKPLFDELQVLWEEEINEK